MNFQNKNKKRHWGFSPCLLIGIFLISSSGCSRLFWRTQADHDTYSILSEKVNDSRWAVPRLDITPDQRSRFYDPYDLDEPPLPPDDPAAHEYMHLVAGMKGYKSWHKFGQTFSAENPDWLSPYGLSPEESGKANEEAIEENTDLDFGIQKLTLPQAVELASIHSREYQTEIENLYLSALSLTFDRFQFAVRYLGTGGKPSSNLTHTSVPHGENSLSLSNRIGVSQLLPTGGQWIVELTNNTLWLFSGGNSSSTASVISYSLVQPLLLGAGRKVVLEGLTLQERSVLYETRNLARFRKEFFTDIVSSYLNILQNRQAVSNRENNINLLEQQLKRLIARSSQKPQPKEPLEKFPEGLKLPESISKQLSYNPAAELLSWTGGMTKEQEKDLLNASDDIRFRYAVGQIIQSMSIETITLDIAQLESRLATSKNGLEQVRQRLANSLDRFKIQLGLPTDFAMNIDEFLLDQFVLIDPRLRNLTENIEALIEQTAKLSDEPTEEEILKVLDYYRDLDIKTKFENNGVNLVQKDLDKADQLIAERSQNKNIDPYLDRVRNDIARDKKLFNQEKVKIDLELFKLNEIRTAINNKELSKEALQDYANDISEIRQTLLTISQSMQVLQIGPRVELIKLHPYRKSMKESVAMGLEQRLDLMNARANMMDARRNLEVVANQLESVLDVRVEGDIGTPTGSKPLNFRGDNSSFRAGLRFTAPLDQVSERNNYRRALIAFQRAKRDYMALEDRIKREIRENHRNLVVSAKNFETTRQAVRINALQYDQAVEAANDPDNTRDQGLNILNALNSVLSAQDQLISIWVSYEQSRLNIHRDMGIMEIDEMGLWNDPFYQQLSQRNSSNHETIDSSASTIGNFVPTETGGSQFGARSGNSNRDKFGNSLQFANTNSSEEKNASKEKAKMENVSAADLDDSGWHNSSDEFLLPRIR